MVRTKMVNVMFGPRSSIGGRARAELLLSQKTT